jgi:hypothetical protein
MVAFAAADFFASENAARAQAAPMGDAAQPLPFASEIVATAPPPVPPAPRLRYLQTGVAFTAELAAGGAFCDDPQLNCILGSGGGIAGRVGVRAADWYWGGALEISKQDPTKLYRLAILKQVRFEARRYWLRGKDTQPLLALGAGLAGYGNEADFSTWGPGAFIGGGVESQVSDGPVIGFILGYRPLYLFRFDDTTGNSHGPGFAHMLALELTLEGRDPF